LRATERLRKFACKAHYWIGWENIVTITVVYAE